MGSKTGSGSDSCDGTALYPIDPVGRSTPAHGSALHVVGCWKSMSSAPRLCVRGDAGEHDAPSAMPYGTTT